MTFPFAGDAARSQWAMASPGFGVRRGTKRRGNESSLTRKITQMGLTRNSVTRKKNKPILITVVRKILKTFDTRDCLQSSSYFVWLKKS